MRKRREIVVVRGSISPSISNSSRLRKEAESLTKATGQFATEPDDVTNINLSEKSR